MAKRNCVLCGKEVGIMSQCFTELCGTSQSLCEECMERCRKATQEEKILLREKMVRSPYLMKRDEVLRNLDKSRQEWAWAQEQARQKQQQEQQRKQRLSETVRCCGQPMTSLGVSTFQLGEHTFFGGDLDHLLSGSMKLALFRCEMCGQIKFFDPEFIK